MRDESMHNSPIRQIVNESILVCEYHDPVHKRLLPAASDV